MLEGYVQGGCSMGAAADTGLFMDHSDLQHTVLTASREQLGLQMAPCSLIWRWQKQGGWQLGTHQWTKAVLKDK